ncbi:hypothetical protein E3N88_02273 [Mikania micrantha]|uniref:Uncharacterized protein n=1 Tax=Mikania micrantha TaxID=192012 RepID=A0A5N6Q5S1_9ASTR|nr:hypothetical protein E3N88_02248 [Mikania micrantha]KAD7479137.1 hypothetical protein E3N88_02273 [Mikania micrantha]
MSTEFFHLDSTKKPDNRVYLNIQIDQSISAISKGMKQKSEVIKSKILDPSPFSPIEEMSEWKRLRESLLKEIQVIDQWLVSKNIAL